MCKSTLSLTAFIMLFTLTAFQSNIEAFGRPRATSQNGASAITAQIQRSPYAIVKLSASWCQPCHALTPLLSQAVTALRTETGKTVSVIDVDIEQNKDFTAQYRFNSVPTMLFFERGVFKGQESGTPGDVQSLKNIIKRNLTL
jgi:thioredoxin 1